jgi:hypothetical protein
LKKITYALVTAIAFTSLPAIAQMPETPPPRTDNMNPREVKRVKMLKQLGHDKKKDPEATETSETSNNNPADVSAKPMRPKMGMLRSGHQIGAGPNAAKRMPSFALVSKRGRERKKHFMRIAKLDRLESIAAEKGNQALAKRVFEMRAKEVIRHQRTIAKIAAARAKGQEPPSNVEVKIDGEPAQP